MDYTVSKNDVKQFCHYTRDSNRIHNPDIMEEFQRKAAIPAMYLLFHNLAKIESPRNAKTIIFNTRLVLSPEDEIVLHPFYRENKDSFNGFKRTILDNEGMRESLAYEIDLDDKKLQKTFNPKGEYHEIGVKQNESSLDGLECHFKPKNGLARTLCFMTSVSGVMQAAFQSPINEQEQKVREMTQRYNLLPVYQGFRFIFPDGLKPTNCKRAKYSVQFEDETPENSSTKQRVVSASVRCDTDDISFNSFFNFKLIPEKMVIRKVLEKLV